VKNSTNVSARFGSAREATAAVDWFRNQRTDPSAIAVAVAAPGEAARPTRAGDNRRTDLAWFVSVDLTIAPVARRIAIETMKREGGKIVERAPGAEAPAT